MSKMIDLFAGLGVILFFLISAITVPILVYKLVEMFPNLLRNWLEYKKGVIDLDAYKKSAQENHANIPLLVDKKVHKELKERNDE